MDDRDTFAAAALTGMMSRVAGKADSFAEAAYKLADAMLRERSRAGQKMAESDSFCAACPERESTNHDAAPAARANAESVAPQPTAGDRSGNPTSHSGTGKQPAPPSVETDGFSPGSRTGPINRTPERESPRRECGESSLRDVARPDTKGKVAGGPEHHISDRSQPVKDCVSDRSKPINDERLAALEQLSALDQKLELEYGLTGNPMIKARRCKAAKTDTTPQRNGALSDGPDPDSRVWETPCKQQPQATPPQGSVQGDGSFLESRNAKEPVAWAVAAGNGEYAVRLFSGEADARLEVERRTVVGLRSDYVVVPLYRHPQPTRISQEQQEEE